MRYGVAFRTTASTTVYVEADSPDDARDLADDLFRPPRLCGRCEIPAPGVTGNNGVELSEAWEAVEGEHGVWRS